MTLTYVAWDTSNNVGKTGDVSNHTLRWVKDGTSSAPTNSATEVDATNVPGLYKVTLTTTETQTPIGTLHGKSSTANISIMPITVHFERTPDAAPGDSGGLPRVSDVLSAFEDTGLVLETTTISGAPTSQTQFNIAAGSADDDAYNYCIIVFEDAATATQRAVGLIKDYTGATKEVFLADAPAFTIADTDNVRILSTNALEIAKGVWDRLLTASTHNIANSAGRRLRALQESGSAYGGYIWIDTVNGTAGTTAYENGTSDNPVDNITDANSLASTLGLSRFKVAPGSDINFAATQQNQLFDGERWTLSLGSQTITNTVIIGATIDGTGNGTGVRFVDCHFLAGASIPPGTYTMCGFAGTSGTAVTSSGTGGQWYLIRCYSDVAGAGTPYFNWSGVSAATVDHRLQLRPLARGRAGWRADDHHRWW
jgi:hypothetical protein